MPHVENRDDADGRLPVFLRVHWLRHTHSPEEGRLLRVLFLRIGALPADSDIGWRTPMLSEQRKPLGGDDVGPQPVIRT
jgi:hypothetical protein